MSGFFIRAEKDITGIFRYAERGKKMSRDRFQCRRGGGRGLLCRWGPVLFGGGACPRKQAAQAQGEKEDKDSPAPMT